ncbi:hypothetical protein F4777DRAFT_598697 [Nemania sp. FL0916]|nr:hypothetical protein F4777DRAFT_598697 [Nemania sp. FL0916]
MLGEKGVSIKAEETAIDSRGVDGTSFARNQNEEAAAHLRLSRKETSLQIGLKYCEQSIKVLEDGFSNIEKHSKQSAEEIWPLENRKDWVAQCRGIIKDNQSFTVRVGVAGATGSGKTSVLNALLGVQELLPTNNEEAATAVRCNVYFNDDTRPEYAFRCHIKFKPKQALEIRLEQFFKDLESRNMLAASHDGSPEDEDALRTLQASLRHTSEMISIVFGLQHHEIEGLDPEAILNSNPAAMDMLGTVKAFNSSKAEEISKMTKPYTDSTVAYHNESGTRFAAWPLIEEVDLFLKSPILLNGIGLVDLPGLGDAVESRASVAEQSFGQLAATMIVTPATRAADNSTAVNLMSKHHEIAMMLDGKFHKQTFCVCISQIDQINRKAALRKPDATENGDLQNCLEEEAELKIVLKKRLQERKKVDKRIRTNVKKLQSKLKHLKRSGSEPFEERTVVAMEDVKSKLKLQQKDKKVLLPKLLREIKMAKTRLEILDGLITFTCIQARNEHLQQRIRLDFQTRQTRLLSRANGPRNTYDGQVTICPTSAHAFWRSKSSLKMMTGFPNEEYTGIPSLASWIRSATIPTREEHVDQLLNRLQAQYNILQLWSENKNTLKGSRMTKDSFEENLAGAFKTMEQSLDEYFQTLAAEASELNPLNGKEEVLDRCPQLCAKAVRSWAYKKPDDMASDDKVHWTTYRASLTRSGGEFVSRAKERPEKYNWMEDISDILLGGLADDWDRSFNHDILSLINKADPVINEVWNAFLTDLTSRIQITEPGLATMITKEKSRLHAIKTSAKDDVLKALHQIRARASQLHPLMVGEIRTRWQGTFHEALQIKGQGSHRAWQKLLLDFADASSERMFQEVYNGLGDRLQACFSNFEIELHQITCRAISNLRTHIGMLMRKVLEPTEQSLMMEASYECANPSLSAETVANMTQRKIPLEYRHAQTELEELEDDDESDSDSGSDADRDLFMDSSSDSDSEIDNLKRENTE